MRIIDDPIGSEQSLLTGVENILTVREGRSEWRRSRLVGQSRNVLAKVLD